MQDVSKKATQNSKLVAAEKKHEQPNNSVTVASVEEQGERAEPSTTKPALDVSSIKKDILKALADARNTIAVIKKSTSVATTPVPVVEKKEQEKPPSPLKKQRLEVVKSPRKAASPKKAATGFATATATATGTAAATETVTATGTDAVAATPADDFDMFSMAALDDHDDAMSGSAGVAAVTVSEASLQSNCDDAEGYYATTIGEVLDGKYRVLGAVGKGVFSTVLRCQCITPLQAAAGGALSVVAVKLIRNNDIMRDAAQTELKLLKELGQRDPRDKKHCIRLLDSFSHRNHVAMVFEPMQMNVREAMKKFGGKGGISIHAVRVFSKHLLIALNHLEACGVIHAGEVAVCVRPECAGWN
jgi:hypothetical protein